MVTMRRTALFLFLFSFLSLIAGHELGRLTSKHKTHRRSLAGRGTGQLTREDLNAALYMDSTFMKNGIHFGMLPNDKENLTSLNAIMQTQFAALGRYAQVQSGTPWTGEQVDTIVPDLKATKAVLQLALMPMGGWEGFTDADQTQANTIATVREGHLAQTQYPFR